MAQYQVIVGNVGTIYDGDKEHEADHHFNDAVERSRSGEGRMGDEEVTKMSGGQPVRQWLPKVHDADPTDGLFSYSDTPEGARRQR